MPTLQHLLFDLDGTLLDTVPDILSAMNKVLAQNNLPPVNLDTLRHRIHGGSQALLGKAFGITEHDPKYGSIKEQFLKEYSITLNVQTNYFTGIPELLTALKKAQIPWGIVTNKPTWLTQPLLTHFPLLAQAHCIICGDTLSVQKPNPEPVLLALQQGKFPSENTVFLGDSEIDMIAGQKAGVMTAIAAYGYIPKHEDVTQWPHHFIIQQPHDLLAILGKSL